MALAVRRGAQLAAGAANRPQKHILPSSSFCTSGVFDTFRRRYPRRAVSARSYHAAHGDPDVQRWGSRAPLSTSAPGSSPLRQAHPIPCFWGRITVFLYLLQWIVGAAAEGDRAAASIALRKKTIYAPQALAGDVVLSCPLGFDMVDGECIRAEIMKPQLLCPYGSFQNQQGACVITDSVVPERVCPSGFVPYEKGCLRKTVVQPIPLCPDTFHASSDAGDLLCTRNVGEKPQWSCQAGVADDDGVCADRQLSPPSITCPNGFVLQQGACIRWSRKGASFECPPGYTSVGDPRMPLCVQTQEVGGAIPSCRPPYVLEGGACVKRGQYHAQPMCPAEFHYDAETGRCRRVKLGRAVPRCREGWTYMEKTHKCIKEEEPLLICPPESNHFLGKAGTSPLGETGCAQVEIEAPVFVCKDGDSPVRESAIIQDLFSPLGPPGAPMEPPALGPGPKGLGRLKGKKDAADWGPHLEGPLGVGETPESGPLVIPSHKKLFGLGMEGPAGKKDEVVVSKKEEPVLPKKAFGVLAKKEDAHQSKKEDMLSRRKEDLLSLKKEERLHLKKEAAVPVALVHLKEVDKVHLKEGHLKEGHLKEGHLKEGPFKEGPFKEGPFKEGSFKEGPFKEGPFKEGPFKEGPSKEGSSPLVNAKMPVEGPPKVENAVHFKAADGGPLAPPNQWQRRAWGPPETHVKTEGKERRLQHKKGMWDQKGEGKGPVAAGKGEFHLGLGLPDEPQQGQNVVCERLEVSMDAFRIECPPGSMATFSKEVGITSCRETRKEPAQPVCRDPDAELQPDGFCLFRETVEPLPLCEVPDAEYEEASGSCVVTHYSPGTPMCPEGLVFEPERKVCNGIQTVPPEFTCPEGFMFQHAVAQDPKELLGDKDGKSVKKKFKKPAHTDWGAAQCEQVELAAVQIVCPVGYELGKNKMGKAEVCIADKQIQGTFTCEPGFFLVGHECVKHIKAEPTAHDEQGSAFPCTLRGSGHSCGHKGPWITEVDESRLGELDPKKTRRVKK